MANYVIQDTTLTNIANAIREKSGSEDAYKPNEMAEAIAAIEGGGSSSGGFDISTLNAYLSANYVENKIDSDPCFLAFKSYIKDPVYDPSNHYTSSAGDSGTGRKYRISGFTKMNQIPSVDKIKAVILTYGYDSYIWFAGMPMNKISDTVFTASAFRSYYNSQYSRGYITTALNDHQFGIDLANQYFYQDYASSMSYFQMIILYED